MMDPAELQRLTDEAREALRRGEAVRAVAIADQIAAAAPDHAAARRIRAEALLETDSAEEALAEARRATELEPHSDHAQRLVGLAAWRCQRLTLAQEALSRAVQMSGRDPELLAEYAWFMASERGPRLAEQAARDAIDADDRSSTAWAALGLAQFRLHRPREAETSLDRALTLNPNDASAQSAMVLLLQEQGRDAQAAALAERLRGTPGTEELVADVQQTARRRRLARMLVQRAALPESSVRDPYAGFALCLMVAATAAAGGCLLVQVPWPLTAFLSGLVLILFFWYLRRILQ